MRVLYDIMYMYMHVQCTSKGYKPLVQVILFVDMQLNPHMHDIVNTTPDFFQW